MGRNRYLRRPRHWICHWFAFVPQANGGAWDGCRLLRPESVEELLKDNLPIATGKHTALKGWHNDGGKGACMRTRNTRRFESEFSRKHARFPTIFDVSPMKNGTPIFSVCVCVCVGGRWLAYFRETFSAFVWDSYSPTGWEVFFKTPHRCIRSGTPVMFVVISVWLMLDSGLGWCGLNAHLVVPHPLVKATPEISFGQYWMGLISHLHNDIAKVDDFF